MISGRRSVAGYERDARLRATLGVIAVIAIAIDYAALAGASDVDVVLAIVLWGAFVTIALFAWPAAGVYAAVTAALLFEQWGVQGIDPLTAQTHFFDNVSSYANVDLRLSMADLLILTTVIAWWLRRDRTMPVRFGAIGWAAGAYTGSFLLGMLVGVLRGGAWNMTAALAELRGPLYVFAMYFLCANLVRTRRQLVFVVVLFLGLIGVKAFQAMGNAVVMLDSGLHLEAVTSHEDVIFFDVALALGLGAVILLGRSRLTLLLGGIAPAILIAELLTQRRVAFVALPAALVLVALPLLKVRRRVTIGILLAVSVLAVGYGAAFWNSQGTLGQPVRAVKGILFPESMSQRDRLSNLWRDLENQNIAFTLRQLPLTGVGLGQEYLFTVEPPELTGFTYWRYMTHNATFWVWLKGGLPGFLALWTLLAATAMESAILFRQHREPLLKLFAMLPATLLVTQLVYSGVDLGLTYSRPMIVLGAMLGITVGLAGLVEARVPAIRPVVRARRGAERLRPGRVSA